MNPLVAVFPESIRDRLATVEERLMNAAQSREPVLGEWTLEPLAAGGKRVRPLLLLTAFDACGGPKAAADDAIDAAVALELIHTASLVHDDLMDEAAERRGRPSTYHAHGNEGAIVVGDYLFVQAFSIAARLPKDALEMTADACRRLCEGQLREQVFQSTTTVGLTAGTSDAGGRDQYMSVIRDKTSALLSAGCGVGASLAGADADRVAAMRRYGEAIGNAFQVLDDVLDVAGDPKWTGKPAGTDFVAGVLSSPYLHFLERGGELPGERTRQAFPSVREDLFKSGAVAVSQLEAGTHTQAALMELEALPEGPAREALERLAELLMERVQ